MNTPAKDIDLVSREHGWFDYWNKKNRGGWLYSAVAEFYRLWIIRPHLNRFIRTYFAKGSKLLHAGCGSGQVDTDLNRDYQLIGLDYCSRALEIYRETQQGRCEILHSSIFQIELPDSSVDGVYNLGVMEHFSEDDVKKALAELKRVLKPGGKAVVFWPPEFGLSVMFFKALTKGTFLLTGKKVSFHPDEISRIQSRKQAYDYFNEAGFQVLKYSFGLRDAFTYVVVVAQKPAL